MEDRLILFHCSLIDGFGPATLTKVVNYLKNVGSGSLASIYLLKEHDFERAGLSRDLAKKIVKNLSDKALLEAELELIQKFNIQLLTILDHDYPEILKSIHLPPLVLYVQGQALSLITKTIAIVGSRRCDIYGSRAIDLLLPELVAYRWVTVSGGAYGIDTLVHKKTLELNGKTIAVLGSGLLNIYPKTNENLFKKVTDGYGALVSCFPLHAPPLAGNFPARNRIIAGLAKACLVIQAAQKSGALITAQYALEQSKDVGAVPGAIDSALSAGCHELIRQGAACVTNSQQILELLNDNEALVLLNGFSNKDLTTERCKDMPETIDDKILMFCKNPRSFDELLAELSLSFHDLNNKLLEFQLKGLIRQNLFGLWENNT